jgi:hypothetical protein
MADTTTVSLDDRDDESAATLEKTVEAARARFDRGDHAAVVALLAKSLERHPRAPGDQPDRALRDLLRVGWTDLGVAYHELGDDVASAEAYRVAVAWGSKVACGNLLTLAMDGLRWSDARAIAAELAGFYLPPDELNALRVSSARIYAELGDRDAAGALAAAHAAYLRELASSDHGRAAALQRSFLSALDAMLPVAGTDLLADVRRAIAAPLPSQQLEEMTADDIATAVRLIGAGKARQLRSLVKKMPALATEPAVMTAVENLPPSGDKTDLQQILRDAT